MLKIVFKSKDYLRIIHDIDAYYGNEERYIVVNIPKLDEEMPYMLVKYVSDKNRFLNAIERIKAEGIDISIEKD